MNNNNLHVAMIMAGGIGERFWPLSRQDRPKQLLPFGDSGKSRLLEVVEHATALVGMENTYIVTGKNLEDPIRNANLPLKQENILIEPCKRNTTGAIAYMAAYLMAKNPGVSIDQISMAVLTVDYRVGDYEGFIRSVKAAIDTADNNNALVTYGVVPTYPATGLGYVEVIPTSRQDTETPVFKVAAFHEKPDAHQAQQYLDAGNFYWNTGVFFWRLSTLLSELSAACPQVTAAIHQLCAAIRCGNCDNFQKFFTKMEDVSIDYMLLEKSKHVMLVEAVLDSPDVGTWTSLRHTPAADGAGNYTEGKPVVLDCRDSIIVNAASADTIAVAALGLNNVTVVVTKDAVLVMDNSREQEVRRIVDELKSRSAKQV
jgi:mannose-1-phosphate guanylyltransferase